MGMIANGYEFLSTLNTVEKIASGKGLKHKGRKTLRRYLSPEKLIRGSRKGRRKGLF